MSVLSLTPSSSTTFTTLVTDLLMFVAEPMAKVIVCPLEVNRIN